MTDNQMMVCSLALVLVAILSCAALVGNCDQHNSDKRAELLTECVKHDTAVACSNALQLRYL